MALLIRALVVVSVAVRVVVCVTVAIGIGLVILGRFWQVSATVGHEASVIGSA
jgi:hypothetical protein